MELDWGDGRYETTAEQLDEAARDAVEALGVGPKDRVLDVGCGTGNAALHAARLGANVTGIDPAERLLRVARQRAEAEHLDLRLEKASAVSLPFGDGTFDGLLAVFSVIFAPEPEAVVREMLRVMQPEGRMVVTTWQPTGAIQDVVGLLRQFMSSDSGPGKQSVWQHPSSIRTLFRGQSLNMLERKISFVAPSAEAWFDDTQAHHPAWRAVKAQVPADDWSALCEESVSLLAAQNEDTSEFRVTSRYWLLQITR